MYKVVVGLPALSKWSSYSGKQLTYVYKYQLHGRRLSTTGYFHLLSKCVRTNSSDVSLCICWSKNAIDWWRRSFSFALVANIICMACTRSNQNCVSVTDEASSFL